MDLLASMATSVETSPAGETSLEWTTLGGYLIENEVARGGMGVVYRARDEALGRQVALKVIAPALAADRAFRERFRRESRLAAQVEHPSVVPIYRAGQDRGRLFIAMRFIEGTDLGTVLREQGALVPAKVAAVIGQLAGALDAAHACGLVHRDVKPANVLLGPGTERAFLTDFGLTIERDRDSGLTRTGTWVGTLAYAAPEQLRGGAVDARTDVYALGGVLYHCLTGQIPYPVARELDAISAHLLDPPPRPSSKNPLLPRGLDGVVARAMAKDPAGRFQSAGDLARAASAAVLGEAPPRDQRSVAVGAAAPAAELRRPDRRRIGAGVSIAIVGLAVLVAVVASLGGSSRDRGAAGTRPDRALSVAGTPDAVAVAGGAVWTMTAAGGALQRTDPRSGRSRAFPAAADLGGGEFPDLDAGGGALWQVQSFAASGGVTKVDPRQGEALGRVGLPGAKAVVADVGGAWATARRHARGRLVRIEPDSMQVTRGPVAAGRDPVAVIRAGDSVWIADRRRDTVLCYDARTLNLRAHIRVGDGPAALATAKEQLWVANLGDRTLTHIDVASGEVTGAPVSLGKEIQAIAGAGDTLWVASQDATVSRVDAATGALRGPPIRVGRPPLSLAADGAGMWVASATDRTVQRLGQD